MPNERYIGDGVYASLDPARMIVLRTMRGAIKDEFYSGVHWIALEPEVLCALIEFAYEIGWGAVVENAVAKHHTRVLSNEEYAKQEEDAERVRNQKEYEGDYD